jgi:NhaA family Na+:H+ antiporter
MQRADLPQRTIIDVLIRPFRAFAAHKLSGAVLLVAAAVVALVWANSPWADSYRTLRELPLAVGIGDFTLSKPLLLWINDGLMAVFFFLVGLEIKREVMAGELSTLRKAGLPIAAAIGGMLLPAVAYLAFNAGGPYASGWGIPMATDIAFALGVLALLGDRVPLGLKVFLTAVAIVDDIGAILVIALFYTDSISLYALALAGGGLLVAILANRLGVRNAVFYFLVGTVVWLGFLKSGVHATLAAVLMAFAIPARVHVHRDRFLERSRDLLDALEQRLQRKGEGDFLTHGQQALMAEVELTLERATPPLQRLERALAPVVTFLVLPVFALANAGLALSGDNLGLALGHPVFWGVVVGLLLGKQLGVLGFAWLAVKLGLADLPAGTGWRQIHATGLLAGIGFTMSLFINALALPDPAIQDVAKLGVLGASLLAGISGYLLLRLDPPRTGPPAD